MSDATSIETLQNTHKPKQIPQTQQFPNSQTFENNNAGNVKMDVKPVHPPPNPPHANDAVKTALQESNAVPIAPAQIDPNAMNNVLKGLQQAHAQGMTTLPTRDIPMDTTQFTHDQQMKPNYIPQSNIPDDYIKEEETYETLMRKKREKMENDDRLDMLYDELQMPILVMVLFFLFHMPFFKEKFNSLFPSLIKTCGDLTMGGYAFKTFLFGTLFYLINKVSNYASKL